MLAAWTDGEGIGLVEVYDLGNDQDFRSWPIFPRAAASSTGDNVMIGGLIITGSSPQRVIVRAIGPSLGIAGQLEDPLLELFDSNGNPNASNNNWKETQQAEIEATTIPPSNDLESAIVTSLAPAAYTAIVPRRERHDRRGAGRSLRAAIAQLHKSGR